MPTTVIGCLFPKQLRIALFSLLALSSGLAQTTILLNQNFGGPVSTSHLTPDWHPPFQVLEWQVDARCYFNPSNVDAPNDCRETYRIVPSEGHHSLCFFDFGSTLFFAGYAPEVAYGTQSFITTEELLFTVMMRVTADDLEGFFQDQRPPYSFPLEVRIYGVEAATVGGDIDALETWQRCLDLADRMGGSGVKMAEPPALQASALAPQPLTGPAAYCVDINTASREALMEIIHIDAPRSEAMLQLRRQRPFSSVDDMQRIDGVGPVRLNDIRAQRLACVR